MRKVIGIHGLILLLTCFVMGGFSWGRVALGFVVGLLVAGLAARFFGATRYVQRWGGVVIFCFKFFKALVMANLQVAAAAFDPRRIRSRFMRYPTRLKTDLEITALADAITLTPGTMTMDVAEDRKAIHIHTLFGEDPEAVRKEVYALLEKPLIRIFE
jgi:multicomponent Na+:H+ antiporter subunit E